MRSFWVVLSLCLVEGAALALLLADRSSSSPAVTPAAAPTAHGASRSRLRGSRSSRAATSRSRASRASAASRRHPPLPAARRPRVREPRGHARDRGQRACTREREGRLLRLPRQPGLGRRRSRTAASRRMNVANNHALDFGADAQAETLAALRGARLAFDGLPGQITRVRAGRVRVALIGVAPYRWAQSLLDMPGDAALVRAGAASGRRRRRLHARGRGRRGRRRTCRGSRDVSSASRAATPRRSRTRWSTPAPSSSSRPGRTSCAGIEWYRRPPDRLQPRQPREEPHARDDRRPRAKRAAPRDARRARAFRRGLARPAPARCVGRTGVRSFAGRHCARADALARGFRRRRGAASARRNAARPASRPPSGVAMPGDARGTYDSRRSSRSPLNLAPARAQRRSSAFCSASSIDPKRPTPGT